MLKITLITLGNKMPSWVNEAVGDYKKRLQDGIALTLVEIPLLRRGKSADLARILEKEATLMTTAIPQGARLIALDMTGESFSSEQLAHKIEQLQHINSHLCFLIGGPEGLCRKLLARCDERWSLSTLTLPHPLVRIVFIEAIYRAWSILQNHPYHK
ncbi:23S rRNA (pseudouridine(1915)-N(3))-methyltransferase RlmH [Legionella oakridgensis]|uniref:Ribosomal RNA large subunit methyltransferase H n=2 Tax=Legionella oakridgensis TaxID=29423 RepID=W0B9X6_9GAMM|nr:23S rRNA (pseudouridine(1915)-N(3))-methyltransferase RlmH [Legionella oakridgensis]AHE66665.1 rRNA large, subunit m3Psi methyltransferase RlmH [Legionella oakridgensis ATCC 33761 = DSM 21215]ETO93630.1 rRNA large, subunit m3Psi methyltransferase RlmH [Legionella oakridgensis RV-2-2007]KTD37744.1 rRNA large subunit methyltransferase [Legionella oakridgensis]STY19804.1 rRNA large subunit methyltransferase [Legionella longbeachae]